MNTPEKDAALALPQAEHSPQTAAVRADDIKRVLGYLRTDEAQIRAAGKNVSIAWADTMARASDLLRALLAAPAAGVQQPTDAPFYISGPYPQGHYAICELGTARVVQRLDAEDFPYRLRSSEAAASPSAQQEPPAGMGWQPIETAPKDGTEILCYAHGDIRVCSWEPLDTPLSRHWGLAGTWYRRRIGSGKDLLGQGYTPTHWTHYTPPNGPVQGGKEGAQ